VVGKLLAIATRSASRAPMKELEEANVTFEAGVEDDLRGRRGKRQVTVLAREAWEGACSELGRALPWTTRRANLLVEGLDLEETTGKVLRVGPVRLEISAETDPCERMDEQAEGLRSRLEPHWRGGVSCRVLTGGRIRPGDAAELED
jgi:MOSC domain-containing protein YiiM